MRSPLLELLRCPACGAETSFNVHTKAQGAIEIETGELECARCKQRFPIAEGCCDLCPKPSAGVRQERAAQQVIEDRALAASPDYADLVRNDARLRAFMRSLPEGYAPMAEQAPVVRYAIGALAPRTGDVALDIGAGMAWTTAMLADHGCRAIAMDISTLYLPRSRFLLDESRYFDRVFADMTSFPVASARCDLVFANAALHHSPDLAATFREIARVLKPGGRGVLVNEPVVGRFERKRVAAFGKEESADGINEHIYRTHEWLGFAEAAGLNLRLEIAQAGIPEKVAARKKEGANSLLRRVALDALGSPTLQTALLSAMIGPLALQLYPFNVVMWVNKR